ncbi:hypothetical protein BKA59DRAFT_417722 [Fusarium tricinctum]|uniref:WSC domain-containing protein n=1 Tax=Fusarium tricinctum TaxID=61284 RepID=A0A8K0S3Y7_9HYPO|nr:hypothetical protein BKA59DRAFT_417722 [Fusarium tricinctum]
MRFTSGVLLALATSVMGQRFTNSSAPATGSATTTSLEPSASAGAPQPVDLGDAELGPGASLVTNPDGSTAVALLASPNGIASFAVGGSFPDGITLGDLIQILFDILVLLIENQKRAATDCTLSVTIDGATVYNSQLETGSSSPSTQGTPAGADTPRLEFVQSCGDNPVELRVSNVKVAAGSGDGGNGGGNPVTETNSEGATTDSTGATVIATETNTNSEGATTDASGETVIPTETNTNSEGATTNSEGETIIPTETNTNSEGATTNSEGETVTATGTTTAATSTATSAAGFPGTVGDFFLFGCVKSTAGFPTFDFSLSDGAMDLELCASQCEGRSYFGVHDENCYCGDEINDDDTTRVNTDECDIECPGDDSEFCGGNLLLNQVSRRQDAIPNTFLLTVYVSVGGADVTLTDIITATETDQSTITTVFTTTITGPSTTETQTITAIYECYNGQCYPETGKNGHIVYIFKPYPGEECDGQTVYISEPCSCKGGSQYVPKYCSDNSCHGLTVYKPEECHDWYNYDTCYTPADCDVCEHGEIVYKPFENSWGTPDHPNVVEIPTCHSSGCPSQPGCTGPDCDSHYNDSHDNNGHEDTGSKGGETGPDYEGTGSKGESGSEGSGSKGETGPDYEGTGSKGETGSEGSGSKGETGPDYEGSGSKGESHPGDYPTIVNSAGKQAVSAVALLAAVAAALL